MKPTLTAQSIRYAADEVASVRNLKRTSAPITRARGRYIAPPPEAKHIIGAILTTRTSWTSYKTADMLAEHLPCLGLPESLDIGIALDTVASTTRPIWMPGMPRRWQATRLAPSVRKATSCSTSPSVCSASCN